ncbi:MAG: hypothetical protein B7X95_02705 [Methylophilaceae bacterium 17-44-8]|jgi:hypothetical protein|nr:MAG: hypothetical protein B7Y48_00870 [Methylophilales bacterium 28-44-11]OZA06446.1 MAG: hypothetical protein B7X95_02705 [Methylophilaceae bacterium 17-44-8]
MSQQINLINPALIKQKDFLTTLNISMVYGALVLSLLGWYFVIVQEMTTLNMSRDQVASELQQVQATLADMTAARAPKAPNEALVKELNMLEEKHQVQTQILQAMQQGRPSQDKGLASYMLGLARQSTDGLWLTGFSIDQTHRAVSLKGRSMDAAILPDYMHKLGREAVFAGQAFSGLRIQQSTEVMSPVNSTQPNSMQSNSLQSNTAQTNTAQVISSLINTAPTTQLQTNTATPFVEFELQASEILIPQPATTPVSVSDSVSTKALKSS